MRTLLPVIVIALALFLLAGLAVWVWLPSRWRRITLPALPLIGAMALAVGLHLTGIFVGVALGLIPLGVIGLAGLILRSWRDPWWRDVANRGAAGALLAALAVGAIGFGLLLVPERPLGLHLVAPGGGSDSFAYISPAAYLEGHALTDIPDGAHPPVWGYTQLMLGKGLRMGEEVDQAAVAAVTGRDPRDTWYTVASLWVLLLPGSIVAAASAIGLRRLTGLAAGLLAVTASVVLSEVIYSHSAGALGLAVVPLATALPALWLDGVATGSRERPPAWAAAGALTALASIYTEFLPALALAALLYTLARRPDRLLRTVPGAIGLAALAVVIGPLVWYRTVRVLLNESGLAQPGPSSFLGIPFQKIVAHYVGSLGPLETGPASPLSYIPLAIMVIGVVLALLLGPARRFFQLILGSIAALVLVLSSIHYFPYGQGEVVAVSFPLVMLAVAAGYEPLLARTGRLRRGALIRPLALTAAVLLIGGFAALNETTDWQYLSPFPHQYGAAAIYDAAAYSAAQRWVAAHGGASGHQAMVLDTQVWDNVWMQYALRRDPGVSFPYVVLEYGTGSSNTLRYFDGRARPYAIVESDLLMQVDPADVMGRAGNFTFLDLTRGDAVIALGAGLSFNPVSDDAGIGPVQWMTNDGRLLIIHSASVRRVTLSFAVVPQLDPIRVQISDAGSTLASLMMTGQRGQVTLALPAGTATVLTMHADKAAGVFPPDNSLRSVGLTQVSFAS